ncbi:MAG: hypothetical protein K6G18_06055 [Treponema sp.]|nr:hypothetical protein [Treponema sp.]
MYFILESAVANGARASAVTAKENFNDARMLFHQVRASALANKDVTEAIAVVLDDAGTVIERDSHRAG